MAFDRSNLDRSADGFIGIFDYEELHLYLSSRGIKSSWPVSVGIAYRVSLGSAGGSL